MNNHLRHFDCIYKLSLRNTRHHIFNESLIALKKNPNKQRIAIFYSHRNFVLLNNIKENLRLLLSVGSHLMCIFSLHFSSALNHDV